MKYELYDRLRKEKGLSHADVSRATGINQSTFSDWKKGKATPKVDKIQKLADLFGVNVEYFVTGTVKDRPSDSGKTYSFSDEAAGIAQELTEDEDLRELFSSIVELDDGRRFVIEQAKRIAEYAKKLSDLKRDE